MVQFDILVKLDNFQLNFVGFKERIEILPSTLELYQMQSRFSLSHQIRPIVIESPKDLHC